MFEELFFLRRKKKEAALLQSGFVPNGDALVRTQEIMDGQFRLTVTVAGENRVTTALVDSATGEDYALYRMASPAGAFVGAVREAVEGVLKEIAGSCFEPDVFHQRQTLAVIRHIGKTYGDELEFLWERAPDAAIWRRKDNQKWYGLLMVLPRHKLGLPSHEAAEIMDLRGPKEGMASLIDGEKYFPGWHMNKKSWYTVVLDGTLPDEEIFQRIDESYQLAKK